MTPLTTGSSKETLIRFSATITQLLAFAQFFFQSLSLPCLIASFQMYFIVLFTAILKLTVKYLLTCLLVSLLLLHFQNTVKGMWLAEL